MKIAIAGAGAMGAFFGFRLQRAGQSVYFIDGWAEHVKTINQQGLSVIEKGQQYHCQIPTFLPEALPEIAFDLILFFTKAMQLKPMLDALKPIISPTTQALILSNGIGNIEVLEQGIAKEKIIAGVTVWSSELRGPGAIEITGSGAVELQQLVDQPSDFMTQLIDIMVQAGLNPTLSPNVMTSIWRKAAINCTLNTYCTLMRCQVGQLGATSYLDGLLSAVLDEMQLVAHAQGIMLATEEIKHFIFAQLASHVWDEHAPSMYQDIQYGRKTEIDYLNGAIVDLADKHHIAVPVNRLLVQLIHTVEEVIHAQ